MGVIAFFFFRNVVTLLPVYTTECRKKKVNFCDFSFHSVVDKDVYWDMTPCLLEINLKWIVSITLCIYQVLLIPAVFTQKYYRLDVQLSKLHVSAFMAMSRDQNAGRIHSVRIDNSTFERVEEFKYLGTTLTNRNSIAEDIKSSLRSGNACYLSVHNLLSSSCYPKI